MIAGKAYRAKWRYGFFVYDSTAFPSNVTGSIAFASSWDVEGDYEPPYPDGTPVFVIESNAWSSASRDSYHRVLLPDGKVVLLHSGVSGHFNEIQ